MQYPFKREITDQTCKQHERSGVKMKRSRIEESIKINLLRVYYPSNNPRADRHYERHDQRSTTRLPRFHQHLGVPIPLLIFFGATINTNQAKQEHKRTKQREPQYVLSIHPTLSL